ncbi:MAG: UDP-N-acetylmuramoyl-L-alanyl-D-glutamate--2,6-diaminopimelate ligase [Candidatus Omnitrophica bacterium]|nr:UDP-N-acetylmuramoyl-L-alanyl-D-glutamate--2,6-diaminopimelate ligase [Candidatus Omnitrophota bacterium]
MMRLDELMKLTGGSLRVCADAGRRITAISTDSRRVEAGGCFVALDGTRQDGAGFIAEAVRSGAAVVVHKKNAVLPPVPEAVVMVGVAEPRAVLGALAAAFYGNAAERLKVIGVTGTNGKTTITYALEHLFRAAGRRSGVIGTIQYQIEDYQEPAVNTTPDILTLQRLFAAMVARDCRYAVMEVSSHALDQGRVNGVRFDYALFTNLTHDHLDYHHDREAYFTAKAKLFRGLSRGQTAIINSDDEYGRRLPPLTPARVVRYALADTAADFFAEKICCRREGTDFYVRSPAGAVEMHTRLIGRHNVYNLLAAMACGVSEGLSPAEAAHAIRCFAPVRGRLECVDAGQPFAVFVDYAHTEDALRNVLSALRQLQPQRLIVVFGCGGDRDCLKRPRMGEAAALLADEVFVTSDNPRGEDPEKIIAEIIGGFPAGFTRYRVIAERRAAIESALGSAQARDIVLLAGKGHETTQIFAGHTVAFDDCRVAREILAHLGWPAGASAG